MARSTLDFVDTYPLAPTVVGSSPPMEHAVTVATRVATSNVKVLITGEWRWQGPGVESWLSRYHVTNDAYTYT
jgi:transcriptional regulator with PAS, ATPase and Fis domain